MVAIVVLLVGAIGTANAITNVNRAEVQDEGNPLGVIQTGPGAIVECVDDFSRLMDVINLHPGGRQAGFRALQLEIGTSDPRFQLVTQLSMEFQVKATQMGVAKAREVMHDFLYDLCDKKIMAEYGYEMRNGEMVPITTPQSTTTVPRSTTTVPRSTTTVGGQTYNKYTCVSTGPFPTSSSEPPWFIDVANGKPCPAGYKLWVPVD